MEVADFDRPTRPLALDAQIESDELGQLKGPFATRKLANSETVLRPLRADKGEGIFVHGNLGRSLRYPWSTNFILTSGYASP